MTELGLSIKIKKHGEPRRGYADATALERDYAFTPKITLREGFRQFAQWYKEYYSPIR